jgi:NAD(P)-dependent dehydrogenase (short-subunit alcohol dehydrogenase family)
VKPRSRGTGARPLRPRSSTTPASASTRAFAETTEGQLRRAVPRPPEGRRSFLTQRAAAAPRATAVASSTSRPGLTRFSYPGYAAYAAMKGGVEVLTRYLAKELGARRISVNTIAPGAIATDFNGGAVRDTQAAQRPSLASITALGRVGLPDDIGGAVAHLLATDAGWITGQRIEISGGMML